MKLPLVSALNRVRLRRRLKLERARLAEMETNATLVIGEQMRRVAALEGRRVNSRDIARSVERRCKAALLAPHAGALA